MIQKTLMLFVKHWVLKIQDGGHFHVNNEYPAIANALTPTLLDGY